MAGIGSEFVLDIYVWKDGNEDVVEEYDEIPLYMGEEGAKQIKQVIWNALGKMLMSI